MGNVAGGKGLPRFGYIERCVPISMTREEGMVKKVEAFQALLLKKTKRALRQGLIAESSAEGRMVSRPR